MTPKCLTVLWFVLMDLDTFCAAMIGDELHRSEMMGCFAASKTNMPFSRDTGTSNKVVQTLKYYIYNLFFSPTFPFSLVLLFTPDTPHFFGAKGKS